MNSKLKKKQKLQKPTLHKLDKRKKNTSTNLTSELKKNKDL